MSFDRHHFEASPVSPEERKRLITRSAKWRAAMAVRGTWSTEQHEAEAERLAAEKAAFPVNRIPSPVWIPYQTRRPDFSHVSDINRAA